MNPFLVLHLGKNGFVAFFSSAYELVDFMATFQLKRRYMTRSDTAHIEQEQKNRLVFVRCVSVKRSTDLLVSNHRNNTSY